MLVPQGLSHVFTLNTIVMVARLNPQWFDSDRYSQLLSSGRKTNQGSKPIGTNTNLQMNLSVSTLYSGLNPETPQALIISLTDHFCHLLHFISTGISFENHSFINLSSYSFSQYLTHTVN